MKIIGITGGIGSGKTEVAKVFKKSGAKIISGDEIGKEVVERNRFVLKKLVKMFGEGILSSNKELNRRKLGGIAFSSIENRDKLNTIVHPYLLSNLKKQIKAHRKKGPGIVIVDAALIIEWGLQKELDYLILVESSFQNRIKRLKEYSGYSQKEAINRIKAQIKDRTRREYADYVIRNDKDLKELKRKVLFLWERLISKMV
ncbi:MAG: dephospho-CoA kinase [candidate division Zixibacteria bacterium]|nr:dephospho-CoA kinase [candidate division Zixibacteria bacterium]